MNTTSLRTSAPVSSALFTCLAIFPPVCLAEISAARGAAHAPRFAEW